MTRRWGRAGQRLTDEEVVARGRAATARRNKDRIVREADDAAAYKLWRAGMVKPYLITMALDAKGLEGPEVDVACGASEPDVDLWEAGELYPTWEQLQLLAALTGNTARFFCFERRLQPFAATSMRFHVSNYEEPELVLSFDPAVVAATVGVR